MSSSVQASGAGPRGSQPQPRKGQLEIQDAVSDGRHTLVLAGELDMASAADLRATIGRVCAADPSAVTLDLRRLSFIDSAGLHIITSTSARCQELGIKFELAPGPRHVQRLFEVTGLLDILPFQAAA